MKLTGEQIGMLRDALCDTFSSAGLIQFTRIRLNIDLSGVVNSNDTKKDAAFNLIDQMTRSDRAIDLIQALKVDQPNNSRVKQICEFLLDGRPLTQTVSTEAFRKKVQEFNCGLDTRAEIFGYLAADKGLHAQLHRLKRYQPSVMQAAAERATDPSRPLNSDVEAFLQECVNSTHNLVLETEFPSRPPKWIDSLEAYVRDLACTDAAKIRRACEQLARIPNSALDRLNEKLIDHASHLKPRELIGLLDGILIALEPETERVRGEVEKFRNLCSELDNLILAHDLCQKMDYSHNQVSQLRPVAVDDPSDWVEFKKDLTNLAGARPADVRVRRTHDAAMVFEDTNSEVAFQALQEKFDDLFFETDEALLRTAIGLPSKAMILRKTLGTFQ